MKKMILAFLTVLICSTSWSKETGGFLCMTTNKKDQKKIEKLIKQGQILKESYFKYSKMVYASPESCSISISPGIPCLSFCTVDQTTICVLPTENEYQFHGELYSNLSGKIDLLCEKENTVDPYPSFGGSN